MSCEKCGTEYTGNFCPNGCNAPAFAAKQKKPVYKKWWFWVLIVLALLVIGTATDGESPDTTTPSSTTAADTTSAPSADSTQPEVTQEKTTAVPANKLYYPGDVMDANGLQITYVSCEICESSNMFLQPNDGCMYIAVKISAENVSSTDRYISSFEFTCYADGVKAQDNYFGDDCLNGGTLSAGRKTEGCLYFEVPVDAEEIEVEYETSFWTDKKAILKVVL